jgi:hypothetical protein
VHFLLNFCSDISHFFARFSNAQRARTKNWHSAFRALTKSPLNQKCKMVEQKNARRPSASQTKNARRPGKKMQGGSRLIDVQEAASGLRLDLDMGI